MQDAVRLVLRRARTGLYVIWAYIHTYIYTLTSICTHGPAHCRCLCTTMNNLTTRRGMWTATHRQPRNSYFSPGFHYSLCWSIFFSRKYLKVYIISHNVSSSWERIKMLGSNSYDLSENEFRVLVQALSVTECRAECSPGPVASSANAPVQTVGNSPSWQRKCLHFPSRGKKGPSI